MLKYEFADIADVADLVSQDSSLWEAEIVLTYRRKWDRSPFPKVGQGRMI